jgi:hypothetical protein
MTESAAYEQRAVTKATEWSCCWVEIMWGLVQIHGISRQSISLMTFVVLSFQDVLTC